MPFDTSRENGQDNKVEDAQLGAVGAWIEFWSSGLKGVLDIQTSYIEDVKTISLQSARMMQEVTRANCEVLSHSPIPEVAHFAEVTGSYIFNTNKRKFDIPNAKSVERTNFHELADLIHVTPETINTNIRPKLVIPAASSHDEMLAQDTSAAMTRYETDHYVLARKSGEELTGDMDTTMNAEIGVMVDAFKIMHEKYPEGFDVLAICEGTQVGFIAAMVCLQEYGFAPENFVGIAAATFPDAYPSEVSDSSRKVSDKDVDALGVNLPSGVRIIPAEINILNFLSQSLEENSKRALELYFKGLHDKDLARKGIHQNKLMMNGRSFTTDNFLGTQDVKGKKERYFADPELQKGYGIYNGVKYYISDYNEGKYIPVGGEKDDIAPIGQGIAILDSLPKNVRGSLVEVKGGHYSTFTGSNWRNLGYPGIIKQTDGEVLNPDIFKEDTLYAA